MLSAVVLGEIFCSPSYKNILEAIKLVKCDKGVLIIIKNYLGDKLNFKIAMERSKLLGIKCEMVVCSDDISLEVGEDKETKARGLCGVVLMYLILGKLTTIKLEFDLSDLALIGKAIGICLSTVGVCFNIKDEVELGYGIHGEKGKEVLTNNSDNINNNYLEKVFDLINNYDKTLFNSEYVLVINNLNSLTDLEMYSLVFNSLNILVNKNYCLPKRVIYGKLMTSLDAKGYSITCLNISKLCTIQTLVDSKILIEVIDIFNDKYNCFDPKDFEKDIDNSINTTSHVICNLPMESQPSNTKQVLDKLLNFLISKSDYLNELDSVVGDGDLGIGLKKSCEYCLSQIHKLNFENYVKESVIMLSDFIGNSFGGTSGPLYSAFLFKISFYLKNKEVDLTKKDFIEALVAGAKEISIIGGAKIGERTMLDVIFPFAEYLQLKAYENCDKVTDFNNLDYINFLDKLCSKASMLQAKHGRSSYLLGKEIGYPDPGCELVRLWIGFILENN